MTKAELIKCCRAREYKKYSNLNRKALEEFVTKHEAVRILSKAVKKWILQPRKKNEFVNLEDIFTTELVPDDTVFRLRGHAPNMHKLYTFHSPSLMKYVLQEGKFQNPFTREPLSDTNIMRLQRAFFRNPRPKEKLLTFRQGGLTYYLSLSTNIVALKPFIELSVKTEANNIQTGIYFLERCQTALMDALVMIKNPPAYDVETIAEMMIYMMEYHLPKWTRRLLLLRDFDSNAAMKYMGHTVEFLARESLADQSTSLSIQMIFILFKSVDKRFTNMFQTTIVTPDVFKARLIAQKI